jgi:hypothetical protein
MLTLLRYVRTIYEGQSVRFVLFLLGSYENSPRLLSDIHNTTDLCGRWFLFRLKGWKGKGG